jgi:hypothetical protein
VSGPARLLPPHHSNPARKERVMSTSENKPKAGHGTPSEVTWDKGKGRQPYSNQGPEEADEPGPPEIQEGDRGEASGRNAEQLDQVRKMP